MYKGNPLFIFIVPWLTNQNSKNKTKHKVNYHHKKRQPTLSGNFCIISFDYLSLLLRPFSQLGISRKEYLKQLPNLIHKLFIT